MRRRLSLAWHVFRGRPLIYGGWTLKLADTLIVPKHGLLVGNHILADGLSDDTVAIRMAVLDASSIRIEGNTLRDNPEGGIHLG